MPRNYTRKKLDASYSKEDILAAVQQYENGNGDISLRQISEETGIPNQLFTIGFQINGVDFLNLRAKKVGEDHFRPGQPTTLWKKVKEYLEKF